VNTAGSGLVPDSCGRLARVATSRLEVPKLLGGDGVAVGVGDDHRHAARFPFGLLPEGVGGRHRGFGRGCVGGLAHVLVENQGLPLRVAFSVKPPPSSGVMAGDGGFFFGRDSGESPRPQKAGSTRLRLSSCGRSQIAKEFSRRAGCVGVTAPGFFPAGRCARNPKADIRNRGANSGRAGTGGVASHEAESGFGGNSYPSGSRGLPEIDTAFRCGRGRTCLFAAL